MSEEIDTSERRPWQPRRLRRHTPDEEAQIDAALDRLRDIQSAKSALDAEEARLLATLIDLDPDPERRVFADEVALAVRWSLATAFARMHTAEVFTTRFTATLALLETGEIAYHHAQALVDLTDGLDAPAAVEVEQRVLGRADRQNLADFRRCVRRAVIKADPAGAAERHDRARADRRVDTRAEDDAMTTVTAFLPADGAALVTTAIAAVADAYASPQGGRDPRSADQRRADALVDICAAALHAGLPNLPVTSSWQGRRPSVQVSVALSTLLGTDDQPAELDGYGPIPAALARAIAADPTGTWRRLVTDPRGRLVDYGRTTYKPPADLREFVIARDRVCFLPGCHRPARRGHIDHLVRWADGGRTDAGNTKPCCVRHHHLKDEAGWGVRSGADGSLVWITPTGRAYLNQPTVYPIDVTH